ncbi:long-chain fatty acid--CoA ligase [uncultured Jatrophihabitans sp.]|uniref:acyl-CoA synthetase n=1 Tax=uncultured Jatrophihabitans sp. TaxID=1610747 RepID=UPI0035CB5A04
MRDHGLGSWPARRARTSAGKTALVDGARSVSYGELAALIDAAARDLRRREVHRNDRVAYLGANSVELVVAMLATARLGAVFVPLNTRLAPPELAYVLQDAEPVLLLHSPESGDVAAGMPCATVQVPLAADVDGPPLDEPIGLDDAFMIQYTSGTSGRPKGVQLSHGNVTWNVMNLLGDVDVATDEISLVTAPLFHTAALNQVLFPTLFKGGTALIEARFDPEHALQLIEQRRVTLLFGVTSMYLALAAVPGFDGADLSSLRSALTGGASVPDTVLRLWAGRGVPLIQGFGMTETSPGATMLRREDAERGIGSAGAAVFFADTRVVDLDGTPVSGGEPGEVQISGPNVSAGYWRNEQATADAFTADGWLRSGDLATVGDDGYVRIVDRLKDMFVSGGENVYPAEVEQAMLADPAVAECAVIGVPDPHWGEVGRAILTLAPGSDADEQSLLANLDGRLARYKIPKSVIVVAELPHNGSGKIRKTQLRKEYS